MSFPSSLSTLPGERDFWEVHFLPDWLLQESGEMYVGPIGREDHSDWNSKTGSRADLPESQEDDPLRMPSSRGEPSDACRNVKKKCGTIESIRDIGVLGEGQHATVYRAFDPFLSARWL